MAPKGEKTNLGDFDNILSKLDELVKDYSDLETLVDERCRTLLYEDDTFCSELREIRSRFNIPVFLNPEMDAKPMEVREEEHARTVDMTLTENIIWATEHPEASPDEIKSQFQNLHEILDEERERTNEESPLERYGLFLGDMTANDRAAFYEMIRELLRKRGLSPVFFEWAKWQVLYREENKSLRPYWHASLGFDVIAYLSDIKDFQLSTKQKKLIRMHAKALINLPPGKHLPTPLRNELNWLFAQSKGGALKPSRKNSKLDTTDHEARDRLSLKMQKQAEKRDAARLRKREQRKRERLAKLAGKEPKK